MSASHKVIGYFAHAGLEVLCEDDGCIIAHSPACLQSHLRQRTQDADNFVIRKTRYCEILAGLLHGAAYCFDRSAYERFLPLARGDGHMLMAPPPGGGALDLIYLRFDVPQTHPFDLILELYFGAT